MNTINIAKKEGKRNSGPYKTYLRIVIWIVSRLIDIECTIRYISQYTTNFPDNSGGGMKTTPFLILFALTVAFGGNTFKERRAVDLRQKNLLVQRSRIPSVEYAKAVTQKVSTGPSEGIVIGTTDYDYAINSGFARRIATYDDGNEVHMVYPHRDVSVSSPQDRLTNVYVYWDASSPTSLTTSLPRQ